MCGRIRLSYKAHWHRSFIVRLSEARWRVSQEAASRFSLDLSLVERGWAASLPMS